MSSTCREAIVGTLNNSHQMTRTIVQTTMATSSRRHVTISGEIVRDTERLLECSHTFYSIKEKMNYLMDLNDSHRVNIDVSRVCYESEAHTSDSNSCRHYVVVVQLFCHLILIYNVVKHSQ